VFEDEMKRKGIISVRMVLPRPIVAFWVIV
jgi:hypothetical protein